MNRTLKTDKHEKFQKKQCRLSMKSCSLDQRDNDSVIRRFSAANTLYWSKQREAARPFVLWISVTVYIPLCLYYVQTYELRLGLPDFRSRNTGDFFSARQHILYTSRAICHRPSVRLYVCLSHEWITQSKTLEVRIMQLSPLSSTMTLVSSWLTSARYFREHSLGSEGE